MMVGVNVDIVAAASADILETQEAGVGPVEEPEADFQADEASPAFHHIRQQSSGQMFVLHLHSCFLGPLLAHISQSHVEEGQTGLVFILEEVVRT